MTVRPRGPSFEAVARATTPPATTAEPLRGDDCGGRCAKAPRSLQRRMRRRKHDGRVHLIEEARTLAQECLPGRILQRRGAYRSAGVEVGIGPDVAGLV